MKYRIVSSHILSKVLKFCTGSSAKSYQCKFAVSDVLVNREPASDELGAALREVIHHKTIRDKFTSVHPDLRARGITRVEVTDEGLYFAREAGENPTLTTASIPPDGAREPVHRASQEASRASQLARAAHSRGDLARAREQYERALGWQSDQMEPWSKLAVVVGETGAYREVREVLE